MATEVDVTRRRMGPHRISGQSATDFETGSAIPFLVVRLRPEKSRVQPSRLPSGGGDRVPPGVYVRRCRVLRLRSNKGVWLGGHMSDVLSYGSKDAAAVGSLQAQ